MSPMKTKTGTCWCGRGPGDEPRRIPITVDLESLGDERIRRLVETAGHVGPWSSREFTEAGIESTVGPSRHEPPPEPDWLAEARQAEQTAADEFDKAHDVWEQAAIARRRYTAQLTNTPTRINQITGELIPEDPAKRKKLAELEQTERTAWQTREDLAVPLHRARAAHSAAENRWGKTVRDRERKLARGDT